MAFTIDTYLVEFLVMRGRSGLLTGKSADGVKKVAGEFVPKLSKKSFVEPLFDVESLPLACKLPMVCVPVGWGVEDDRSKRVIPKVGELVGCYLNPGTYNMSLPFRLHNTKDSDHYYALFTTR